MIILFKHHILAKNQWVQVLDVEQVKGNQIKYLITDSYEPIKSKLTNKFQKEIDLLD
jgi:predicted DNA-binding protein (MmcQ/YjbR family)